MRQAYEKITISQSQLSLVSIKKANVMVSSFQKVRIPDNFSLAVFDVSEESKVYSSGIVSVVKSEKGLLFQKEVMEKLNLVFCNVSNDLVCHWGTFNRFDILDTQTNETYNVGCSGTITVAIKNVKNYAKEIGLKKDFVTIDDISDLFRDIVVGCVKKEMMLYQKNHRRSVVSINNSIGLIQASVKNSLMEKLYQYGFTVNEVKINNLDIKQKESQETNNNVIKRVSRNCPRCKVSVDYDTRYCPECGCKIE